MTAGVVVKVVNKDIDAALARLKMSLPLGQGMQGPMEAIGRALKTAVQMRFRQEQAPDGSAWEPSRRAAEGGGQTLSLTRRLRNSITYHATPLSVEVGTNVLYAAIHQFGGVIRAKRGPFLAIPVTPAARAAGSPRNMADLAVVQTLGGQYILVDKAGATQFLLRRQVTMPARPFLGASDADSKEIVRVVSNHLNSLWRRA